jgi:hypothetical protein
MSRVGALVLMICLLGACEGGSASSEDPQPARLTERSDSDTSESAPPTETPVVCPNPEGGVCLGELEGASHRTQYFIPDLTYTAPAGWSNMEDLPGNFLLLPPGRTLDGVDAGEVDYLGIYSGVSVAAADCSPQPAAGVGQRPEAVVTALAERPGLRVTPPRDVEVGGLRGQMVVIELVPGTGAGCTVEGGLTIVPLFIGVGPASVEHAQVPGLVTHLYVLRNGDSNVLIEASDVKGDRRPFDFGWVVNELRFAPG